VLSGDPTGSILPDFHGAYLAPASADGAASAQAVLLLTDAFGMSLPNPKIMADKLSKELGCDVWVPDYFAGRPLIPASKLQIPERAGIKQSFWTYVKLFFVLLPQIPAFYSNRASAVDARLTSFINHIKQTKQYNKIGAVGYCYGGSTCIRFGKTGLVDSVIIAHPGRFTIDDVKAIKVPALWLCAEEDQFFQDEKRLQSEAVFAARKDQPDYVDYEFQLYKGTAHGFASRPNLNLPEIKEAWEGAFQQTINWFKKTLWA